MPPFLHFFLRTMTINTRFDESHVKLLLETTSGLEQLEIKRVQTTQQQENTSVSSGKFKKLPLETGNI